MATVRKLFAKYGLNNGSTMPTVKRLIWKFGNWIRRQKQAIQMILVHLIFT